jgi:hypothetical protein
MRTLSIEVFQFDELDAKSKERARDWYRLAGEGDNSFADTVIDDAVEVAQKLGITFENRSTGGGAGRRHKPCIWWSGFWSQGDGASFEGGYDPIEGKALDRVKDHAPEDEKLHLIASRLDALQEKYGNSLTARVSQRGRYVHAYTMRLDRAEALDGEGEPVDIPAEDAEELLDALRDFANWIYGWLEKEYDYQNSDDVVDETIRANEYEFRANGARL